MRFLRKIMPHFLKKLISCFLVQMGIMVTELLHILQKKKEKFPDFYV